MAACAAPSAVLEIVSREQAEALLARGGTRARAALSQLAGALDEWRRQRGLAGKGGGMREPQPRELWTRIWVVGDAWALVTSPAVPPCVVNLFCLLGPEEEEVQHQRVRGALEAALEFAARSLCGGSGQLEESKYDDSEPATCGTALLRIELAGLSSRQLAMAQSVMLGEGGDSGLLGRRWAQAKVWPCGVYVLPLAAAAAAAALTATSARGAHDLAPHIGPAPELPEGWTAGPVRAQEVDAMDALWKFRSAHSQPWLAWAARSRPSIVLRDQHDEPQAWAFVHTDGSIGTVHVRAQHRGRGVGRLLISHLLGELRMQGYSAYCFIDDDNATSSALFTKLGFVRADDVIWTTFTA
jgi:ribosomal protein S18 acetylase RimI-like enzyme